MVHSSDPAVSGPDIAVIAISLRFPGADSPEEFWGNLVNGVNGIARYTDEQLLADGVNPSYLKRGNYVKAGGLPRNHRHFSPEFFAFSGREAELLDPQHRIALECVHEALERAGCDPNRYPGKIGVYAGAGSSDYRDYVLRRIDETNTTERFLARLGNDNDFLSTRISYKLNLKGPSLTVQSACSTSLVAVHLARKALQARECDLAIAGGVSLESLNTEGYFYMEGGMISPDGLCRAFDTDAKGTVFTSGAGFVVLKRLDNAFRDRDRIYAVIKGSAINNDGNSKVGYFAPSVEGQIDVIESALRDAGITADSISYVEAHGTATPLGDPIEVEALTSAYRKQTQRCQYCALGSVKTNIGHLNTAAGISGFIKTCLCLAHRQIPPTLHFRKANPNIDFGSSPFYVNSTLAEWAPQTLPRRAGVTALGVGGTNAHVILEEEPGTPARILAKPRASLIPLSAKDPESLSKLRLNLADFLENSPDTRVEDVAFTLPVGRTQHDHRRAFVAHGDIWRLIDDLRADDKGSSGSAKGMVFVLPGFGCPRMDAVQDLCEADESFAKDLESCIARFDACLQGGFSKVFQSTTQHGVLDIAYMEPALFCLQFALANLLRKWGLKPVAILGYGVGEYVAAVLAGVLDFDMAVELVALRAKCLQNSPRGQIMEIPRYCAASDLVSYLVPTHENDLGLGFAGTQEQILKVTATLTGRGVPVRLLGEVTMPTAEQFLALQSALAKSLHGGHLSAPTVPVVSGWSGQRWDEGIGIDARYWCDHAVKPANLDAAQREINSQFQSASILQFGQSSWIGDMFLRCRAERPARTLMEITALPHMSNLCVEILDVAAQAWIGGNAVDWSQLPFTGEGRKMVLPTYPLKKRLVWFDGGPEASQPPSKPASAEFPSRDNTESVARRFARHDDKNPVNRTVVQSSRPVSDDSGRQFSFDKGGTESPGRGGTTTAQRLADICAQILKEKVSDHGSSFLELGGDSIRATQFIWLVEKELKIRLDVEDVLYKSIEELAASVKGNAVVAKVQPVLVPPNPLSTIMDICKRSLKIENVEPSQTFLDCGGDSIRATQFIWLVEKELKARLDVEDVLYKSIAELAAMIGESSRADAPAPKQVTT